MSTGQGLRARKRAQTRERLADVAAELFAERDYDAVSVVDVARAADVSEQTVYNYYPAKQDLVLDRAQEIRDRYSVAVRTRDAGISPAEAIRSIVVEDVDRLRHGVPAMARGKFSAQCVLSPVLRRFALEFRTQQAETIAQAVLETDPQIPAMVAQAHAAALVSIVQAVTDAVGGYVIVATETAVPPPATAVADRLQREALTALDDLDRTFRAVTSQPPKGGHQ